MSGYEPGRSRIEEREAQYIWVGTRILLGAGVEWTVTDVFGHVAGRTLMELTRSKGEGVEVIESDFIDSEPIRCRVEKEER